MSRSAQLASRIVVCHREPGFLRLELPAELCTATRAEALERGAAALAGVRSAAVDRGWRRISLRHDPAVLGTAQLARRLAGLIDALPDETAAESAPRTDAAAPAGGGLQPLLDRVRAALPPADAAPPGSLQARLLPVLDSALNEKAILNFFNDIVVFYLVRVHWDLITKQWLKQPLAHSNAWMTTFYLVFLLIRYRKSSR